jgi:ABC-type Fe3+-hydroxamate transport system substrate-binding protein
MKVQDQTGNWISLEQPPKRIVSLVPSISELLVNLDLEEELIGVTRFCTHPSQLRREKVVIGGTKDPDLKKIIGLQPDLIIANKEENVKDHVEFLRSQVPVYLSDVNCISDNLNLIYDLGRLLNRSKKAQEICKKTRLRFDSIKGLTQGSVLYVIWQDPIMVAGQNTIIDSVLNHCGFTNLVDTDRYPEIRESTIKNLSPDYIFLSSEPYPFKEKNQALWQEKFPDSKILLVDGRAFSWYGYCFQQTPIYIQNLWNEIQV